MPAADRRGGGNDRPGAWPFQRSRKAGRGGCRRGGESDQALPQSDGGGGAEKMMRSARDQTERTDGCTTPTHKGSKCSLDTASPAATRGAAGGGSNALRHGGAPAGWRQRGRRAGGGGRGVSMVRRALFRRRQISNFMNGTGAQIIGTGRRRATGGVSFFRLSGQTI